MEVQSLVNFVDGRPISHDSRSVKPGDVFIAIHGELADGHDYLRQAVAAGAVAVIVDHPVTIEVPSLVVEDTLVAFQQLAAYHRAQFEVKAIAVTGSCGKTTTRALLQSIFSQVGPTLASVGSYNNHFGVPLTLLNLRDNHQYFVSEIGANHMGEIATLVPLVKPDVAMITNIGPAHLEGFGSLENTAKAKSEIYDGLSEAGVAIVNADDQFAPFLRSVNKNHRMITFGIHQDADVMADSICINNHHCPTFTLVLPDTYCDITLQLLGAHNVYNALAAAAAGVALGLTIEQIKVGLEAAVPENKRLNAFEILPGITLIDDSYNANPLSTRAAIETLGQQAALRILVLGDMLELGDEAPLMHAQMGDVAKDNHINRVYCFGPLTKHTVDAFGEGAYHFSDRAALAQAIQAQLASGQTILVKGSNSMKMFQIVEALKAVEATA